MAGLIFLGVDGGGSKTVARIRDETGRLLGEGSAGAGNARLGDAGYREIMNACRQAASAAGFAEADLARFHAGFGLAGTQQDEDLAAISARAWPFASIVIDTDAYTSWLGAFRGEDGAILILGTGSAGLAILQGRRLNVGGWGADIADDGSGMAIGRLAIRKSLWAHEGMASLTPLAKEIMATFDNQPTNAVLWAGDATPGDFAAYAPRVFAHGAAGDELATGILRQTGEDAAMLIRRLLELGAPKVAMIGGVFPRLYPWLPEDVKPTLVEPRGNALDGAILMAERARRGIGTDRPKR